MVEYGFQFFFENIKFQIVSAIILLILEISYFRRMHLPTLSSKIFTALMIFSGIYIIFDFLTVYAIVYMERVSSFFLRFTHQIFIFSINTIMLCLFLYVSISNSNQRRLKKRFTFIIFGLYFLSIIFVLFGKIEYYRGPDGIYSFGSMPYSIFAIATIYGSMTLFRTLYVALTNKNSFIHFQFRFIFSTLIIWFTVEILQFLIPTLLISNIGISNMVLIMYLGLEQPSAYLDQTSQKMNTNAFKQIIHEYKNSKTPFSIITIEMENILSIETEYGENIYTALIQKIANHIETKIKRPIYRLTDSSLSIIIPKSKKFSEDYISRFLQVLQEDFKNTWEIDSNRFTVFIHCSLIEYPKDSFIFRRVNELISFISNFNKYSEETSFIRTINKKIIENISREKTIVKIIEDAIKEDGIEMFLQPIYNIEKNSFSNAEALVRLKDNKTIGFISPEEFIPLAEKHGLITNLSDKIFKQVFSFMSENKLESLGLQHIEVNLSAIQSEDPALPLYIQNLLTEKRISPKAVNLEITESAAISKNNLLENNIKAIKSLGCSFSMDDFGTGYSNLSQIAKVDYELIKLDKSLLWPCFDEKNPDRNESKIILENMINMILKLGKKIVVEGVESQEQFEYLKSLKVTYIQGYYFSKPLPMKNFLEFIKEKN